MRCQRALLPLVALLWALPASTSEPYLVKDINPVFQNGDSLPGDFVQLGKYALFAATTLLEGRELWASDGTPAGTFLLADACPGECYGDPVPVAVTRRGFFFLTRTERYEMSLWVTQGTPASTIRLTEDVSPYVITSPPIRGDQYLVWLESQGFLYFVATDASHGAELWRTDGTPAGTVLVADIRSGSPGSQIDELTVFRDRIFFSANDGVSGSSLWTTDGTRASTRLVKDTWPGDSSSGRISQVRASSRFLFFLAPGPQGVEFWRSDGTTRGTQIVTDLAPGPGSPLISDSIAVGSRLYMAAALDDKGYELWVSDGTVKGTRRLTDFRSTTPFFTVTPFRPLHFATPLGNRLAFAADDGPHGRELWVTDGTSAGTRQVSDLCPGPCAGAGFLWHADQNRIFFSGTDGQRGLELWVSDGTPTGTRIVRDICRKDCSSRPQDFTSFGGRLFFHADDGRNGRQIWRTDGTGAGTIRVSDLEPGNFEHGLRRVVVSGKLFFTAKDSDHGWELWVSDGTLEGTRLLADLDDADRGGSFPSRFMPAGNELFFFADDGLNGKELWKSDGTTSGTALVHEFVPGPSSPDSLFSQTAVVDGTMFFEMELEPLRHSLWRTDGTDAGTFRLTAENVAVHGGPRTVGSKVFFAASDSLHGTELWVSDGTTSGTRIVADLTGTFTYEPAPADLTSFQGKLYFTAKTEEPFGSLSDRWLWTSDGTESGTVPVSGSARNPRHLTVHQGFLYFFAEADEHGTELWRSDGTATGTRMVADLKPGRGYLDHVTGMISVGLRLVFGVAGSNDREKGLWVSDGTSSGTRRISPVLMSMMDSHPFSQGPFVLDGVIYSHGWDGSTEALWRTDGTEVGTFPLRDRDGRIVPSPPAMVASGGRLYFISPDVGATLWQSDGTPAGTFPIRQLEPGEQTSGSLEAAGSRVFVRAFDPATGFELWAIDTRPGAP